jgi:hypothetical protein
MAETEMKELNFLFFSLEWHMYEVRLARKSVEFCFFTKMVSILFPLTSYFEEKNTQTLTKTSTLKLTFWTL